MTRKLVLAATLLISAVALTGGSPVSAGTFGAAGCNANWTRTYPVVINFENYTQARTSTSDTDCRYVSTTFKGTFVSQNRGGPGTISATVTKLGNQTAFTSEHWACTGTNATGTCAMVTAP